MTARLYLRVSTQVQAAEGFSMAAQERKARAWCEYQGLTDVLPYPEAAVSGRRDDRPQLTALLADLQRGDTVVVYALSRLGRGGAIQMLHIVHRIREAGARLVSLTEQIDTESTTGRLMLTILAALAEMEVELTRERTEFGRLQAASQGVYPHSARSLPMGWTTGPDGRIVEDPASAETVRLIFAQGRAPYESTARLLTAHGVPAERGGTWEVSQIRGVVSFAGYRTGVLQYRRTALPDRPEAWIDIPAPALVSEAVWLGAQRDGRVNNVYRDSARFPLTGHLLCTCGAKLYGRTRTNTGADLAYRCTDRGRAAPTCSNGNRSRLWLHADQIHAHARAALARYLTDPSDPARLQQLTAAPASDPHAEERADLDRRMAALVDLHLDGLLDRAGYEVRHAALTAQRRALHTPTPTARPADDLSHFAPLIEGAGNEELADLLDILQATLVMQEDGGVRVLHVQPMI